jgi:hypothetical protein
MYRWYLDDPIHFDRSLRWTIEHGHANNFGNDYSSVAYWYQTPAVAVTGTLPDRAAMLPRLGDRHDEARRLLEETVVAARELGGAAYGLAARHAAAFYTGEWDQAVADLAEARRLLGIA